MKMEWELLGEMGGGGEQGVRIKEMHMKVH